LLPTIGPFPVSSQRRDMGFSSCLLGLNEALLNTNGHRQRQRPEFITGSLGGNGWGVKGFGAAFVKGARSFVRVVRRRGSFVRISVMCKNIL
jgi:hypothetical protein